MKLKDIYNKMDKLSRSIKTVCIGQSVLNYPIYAFFVGNNKGGVIICEAAIHAREYISAFLLLNLAESYAEKKLDFGIWFVPLVNPDGVGLCLEGLGLSGLSETKKEELININGKSKDFSLWKANISGVDLNVNFDALWGGGKHNLKIVAPSNYIGKEPCSEPEVKSLIKFTKEVNPSLTLSFHTKGEVIYWGFETLNKLQLARDKKIVSELSKINGYKSVKTKNSTGGYSDYVSKEYGVPAFTVELGADFLKHPIKLKYLKRITKQNEGLLLQAGKFLNL